MLIGSVVSKTSRRRVVTCKMYRDKNVSGTTNLHLVMVPTDQISSSVLTSLLAPYKSLLRHGVKLAGNFYRQRVTGSIQNEPVT